MNSDLAPVARGGRSSRRRALFAGVTIALWALAGVVAMLPVFRDVVQSHYGISTSQFGLLISIGSITGAVGAMAGGLLVDRRGPRPVLRLSLLGCAGGMALAAVPAPWAFMAVALGVTYFFFHPLGIAAQAYLVRVYPRHRRRVLSLSLVAVSGAGIIFPLLAEGLLKLRGAVPSIRFSHVLHVPFAVVAGIVLLGSLLYRPRRAARTPAGQRDSPKPTPPALGASSVLLVVLMVIHATCDSAANLWMPRVLGSRSFAEQVFLPGAVIAAFSLVYVVSRTALAVLPEHWGARTLMIAPGLLGGGIFLAGILSRSQAWTSVGYVGGALCWSFEYPTFLAALAGNGRKRFGSAMGLFMIVSGLTTFVMASLMGYVGDRLGETSLWKILLIPAAGFPLVGLGGAIWVRRFGRRTGATEAPAAGQS